MRKTHVEIDLTGFYDLHVHSSPDVIGRKMDDFELAQAAAAAGLSGILLKSHVTNTAQAAAHAGPDGVFV